MPTVDERLWVKIDTSGPGCWPWTAGCHGQGYGAFHPTKGQTVLAHRFVYERVFGSIPEGMVVDHMCHNESDCKGGKECPHRKCCNPDHLALKTNQENLEASPNWNGNKTRCPQGHEYTDENTRWHRPKPGRKPGRSCLACARTREQERIRMNENQKVAV
jgi:hypothetical protein